MKALWYIVGLIVLILIILFIASRSIISKLGFDVKFKGVDINSILGSKSIDAVITIVVKNDNNLTLKFKIKRISLFYDDTLIATSTKEEKYVLYPNSTTNLDNKIRFFVSGKTIQLAKEVTTGKKPTINYIARISVLGIPINIPGEFEASF